MKFPNMKSKNEHYGFFRIAAAVPPVKVGDLGYNAARIVEFAKRAEDKGAAVILFPELCLTGYTAGDLFHQRILLERAESGLEEIIRFSKLLKSVLIVGLPVEAEGKLFNTAAVVSGGRLRGIVPKTYIPGYKEFYEERWFASGRDLVLKSVRMLGKETLFGTDLIFRLGTKPEVILGVEICEDLWAPLPPSSFQSLFGANVILNLSASNELAAKADYRRILVGQQSARTVSVYVYSSAGVHESTTDLVFGGHALIAENGTILRESERFKRDGEMVIADIDLEHLAHDREQMTSFGEAVHESGSRAFRTVDVPIKIKPNFVLLRQIDPLPFVPRDPVSRDKRSQEIFSIQVAAIAKRLEQPGIKDLVIGVSGGLDSTLALLVSVRAFALLGYPLGRIHAYTMPGFATSGRTKSNAKRLSRALGVKLEEIDIKQGTLAHFKDIKQNSKQQNITYQNAQARYRTMVLMNKANQLRAIVVGTGDLSELALGWNTFSGDHISHYDVNAGVPKTLVRYLVEWVADTQVDAKTKRVLLDIIATPISPELVKKKGEEIGHKTEKIIGPYELHDFFLYHFLRWGSRPRKILFLAECAFTGKYAPAEIRKWLRIFIKRFFANQWKRSVMPDGPKVGSVALSPRGDWRMPSDAEVKLWLEDLH